MTFFTTPVTPEDASRLAAVQAETLVDPRIIGVINRIMLRNFPNGTTLTAANIRAELTNWAEVNHGEFTQARGSLYYPGCESVDGIMEQCKLREISKIYQGRGWVTDLDVPGYNESYSTRLTIRKRRA